MFAQFLSKGNFYNKYMQLYAMRQAIANLQLEDNKTDILSLSRIQEMYNNVIAFENIIEMSPNKISPYDLIEINKAVNGGIFNSGFRKTQVDVRKAKNFYPPDAKNITSLIYSLFDTYHNIWIDAPLFIKESQFHIELVRIQPFEDGNKRTARILTNFNLCNQNKAPVVINGSETDRYFGYIDDYDVEGLAEFLKEKSEQELMIMVDLYRSIEPDSNECDPIGSIAELDIGNIKVVKKLFKDIASVEEKKNI